MNYRQCLSSLIVFVSEDINKETIVSLLKSYKREHLIKMSKMLGLKILTKWNKDKIIEVISDYYSQ